MIITGYRILPDPFDKITAGEKQIVETAGFKIAYAAAEEIRMGLFASEVSVFKNGRNVTDAVLGRSFLSTIPRPFEPLSFNGDFTFIPSCPVAKDNRPVILNTGDLSKSMIENPGHVSANQFARHSNLLLLTGYDKLVLFDCDKHQLLTFYTGNTQENIEFGFFSGDETKIMMMQTDHGESRQSVLLFDLSGTQLEAAVIKTPDDIFHFGFEKYEPLAKQDRFNLFNTYGYAFAAAGRTLNKWSFRDYDKTRNEVVLRSHIPVSGIYYNPNWKQEGCDIRVKEVGLSISV